MKPIKQLKTFEDVLQVLEGENAVLHAPTPGATKCELTYPNEDFVAYECEAAVWTGIIQALSKGPNLLLVHVYLLEPDCAGGWAIVATTNSEALSYRVNPPTSVATDEDEE